ncbi:MAG: hypothetical protein IT336_08360 [Thermomicrobiales bacterium]|nr:hypothetical protein [Thermomicrobiales bacterium]
MVVFPAVSALISLICAGVIARDAIARPRPDKIAWTIAFAIFAVAAASEVVGSLSDWTPTLVRVYYLTGAVLVVGYLALGELYLVAGNRIHRFAPGVTLLVTAVAATVVLNANVDEARLDADGWEAIERGAALKTLAIGINSIGTLVIVGGLVYSAWRFKKLGIQRNRMIGCLLIALGTIAVGMGGTLTRFGQHEYLYIAMSVGVAIIFAGYLQTRRAVSGQPPAVSRQPSEIAPQPAPSAPVRAPVAVGTNGHHPGPSAAGPGIAFLEARLRDLDDAELSGLCRVWSVAPTEADAFSREEARRAWVLRSRLTVEGQARFDALPVPVRIQVTVFYFDVMEPVAH